MPNFLVDEDTDLLAAEFVLGTLDSEERANAQSLLRTDHGFIAMVRIWERRFGELHLMVEPVEPDPKIFQRVKAKIAELAPSEPAPASDGKPAVEGGPQPPAATGAPPAPDAETQKPPETLPNGEVPKPPDVSAAAAPDVPASGTSPTTETEKPPETPPDTTSVSGSVAPGPVLPTAAVLAGVAPAAAETSAAVRSEPGPAIPAPPSALKPADEPPDRASDRAARRPEITIDVIRSRRRWRVLGVCMSLLVVGLVALLAAWRFIPDRVPAGLRPAELMTSIGIQTFARPVPAIKPAPPESGFDE
jgi:hypothetical protein